MINPTFTFMTKTGIYENSGFKMIEDYRLFYQTASEIIEAVKNQDGVKDTFNDSPDYDEYYISCNPWISIEGMNHALPDHNTESSSCSRLVWDKYREENGEIVMVLNITVNHCFVDGYPLSQAFINIQKNFENAAEPCR